MPGRRDFGILRSEFMSDTRAHTAAALFVERGLAVEGFGLATVSGVVVQLGLWAMRETDDGVLPGDGAIAAQVATMMSRAACRSAVDALTEAGLLRARGGGLYLAGFRDCYEPIIDTRQLNRAKAQRTREKSRKRMLAEAVPGDVPGDVPENSALRTPPRRGPPAVPCRAVPTGTNPPPSADGGGSASPSPDDGPARVADVLAVPPPKGGHPLTESEREGVLAACGAILGQKDLDDRVRDETKRAQVSVREGLCRPAVVREFVRSVVWSRTPARVAYLATRKDFR